MIWVAYSPCAWISPQVKGWVHALFRGTRWWFVRVHVRVVETASRVVWVWGSAVGTRILKERYRCWGKEGQGKQRWDNGNRLVLKAVDPGDRRLMMRMESGAVGLSNLVFSGKLLDLTRVMKLVFSFFFLFRLYFFEIWLRQKGDVRVVCQ